MKDLKRSYPSYLILLFSCLCLTSVVSAQIKPALRTFVDKKNGYFRTQVPASWRQQDYDDSRTKVAFYHPTEQDIYIRFIVREAEGDYSVLLKEKKEWARTATGQGIHSSVSEETIGPFRAVIISSTIPNTGSIEQVFFLQSGIQFHISLGGKQKIERYHDLFRQVVASILPRPSSSYDPAKAKSQLLSWYVRSAELQIQSGNRDLARDIAKEGLVEFPDSQRLKEIATGK